MLGGVTLAILIPMLSALWATLATAAGLGVLVLLQPCRVDRVDMVLPLAAPVLMALALYIMNMAYGYFVESRSKRQLAERFGEYVPPELVDRMARGPGEVQHGAAQRRAHDPVLRTCAASPASPRRSSPRSCASTSTSISPT